jgi:hypothetical protein
VIDPRAHPWSRRSPRRSGSLVSVQTLRSPHRRAHRHLPMRRDRASRRVRRGRSVVGRCRLRQSELADGTISPHEIGGNVRWGVPAEPRVPTPSAPARRRLLRLHQLLRPHLRITGAVSKLGSGWIMSFRNNLHVHALKRPCKRQIWNLRQCTFGHRLRALTVQDKRCRRSEYQNEMCGHPRRVPL